MHRFTWLLVVGVGLIGAMPGRAAGPLPQQPPHHLIVPEVVIGVLVRIEGDLYLVQDKEGKTVRLRVSPHDTLLDKDLRVGDKVTAEVFQDGRARSVVKAPR